MLQFLDTMNAKVTRVLLAVAAAIIFCLGFLVCADIFGRALFSSPVKGTPEIVSMSIVIITFLLAGYAVQSGSMIYTNVITGMFGIRGEAFGKMLSALLGILFFGLIVWGSFEPTIHAWASGEYEGEGALRVPVWPARVAVLVGAGLVVVSYALHGVHAACMFLSGKPAGGPPPASTHL